MRETKMCQPQGIVGNVNVIFTVIDLCEHLDQNSSQKVIKSKK